MKRRIVSDSSINQMELPFYSDFSTVPMKIMAGTKTYIDDQDCNVQQMVKDLSEYKGRTTTACPSPQEWLESFGDAEEIFALTISSNLSGSHNAAQVAANDYMQQHPGRKVHVQDSWSTGAEMLLMSEMVARMIGENASFEDIKEALDDCHNHLELVFTLRSVHSLANNGRLSPAIAALIGILGVRLVGCASEKGELEMMSKCRGEKKAIAGTIEALAKRGYSGGRIHIEHCCNAPFAEQIRSQISAMYPQANITVGEMTALCSYYAEEGGIIIGFEK